MARQRLIGVLTLCFISLASSARADGWRWPWQDPAPPAQVRPTAAQLAGKESTGQRPSTMSKMTSGTKNMFTTTKNVLLPGSSPPKGLSVSSASIADKHASQKPSWFQSHQESTTSKTIKDFVSAPRVKP